VRVSTPVKKPSPPKAKSPAKKSKSPVKKAKSPFKKSKSPVRKSKSPKRSHSRSVRKPSNSPNKYWAKDPLCAKWRGWSCVKCATRAYFGKNGKCVNSNPLCKTFDNHDGCCTSCYAGYDLKGGNCVVNPNYNAWRSHSKKRSVSRRRRSSSCSSRKNHH
jgi:hypothetical protein